MKAILLSTLIVSGLCGQNAPLGQNTHRFVPNLPTCDSTHLGWWDIDGQVICMYLDNKFEWMDTKYVYGPPPDGAYVANPAPTLKWRKLEVTKSNNVIWKLYANHELVYRILWVSDLWAEYEVWGKYSTRPEAIFDDEEAAKKYAETEAVK